MGCIYLITNKVNNKVYVGQTITHLNRRMSKHYTNAKCNPSVTGVDGAIKKYGKNNFTVRILCNCANDQLNDLEKFYIQKYESNNPDKGYNLTIGGEASWRYLNLNEEEVIKTYQKLKSITKTAQYYNCCHPSISDILHKNNIKVIREGHVKNIEKYWGVGHGKRAVKIIELGLNFNSIKECAQWLIQNKYTYSTNEKNICKQICKVLKNKVNSFHKLTFNYI